MALNEKPPSSDNPKRQQPPDLQIPRLDQATKATERRQPHEEQENPEALLANFDALLTDAGIAPNVTSAERRALDRKTNARNGRNNAQNNTSEEPEESGFKGIFKKIATLVTQVIEGLKSMGSEVLTHLANFFNSNSFRGLAQAARETEQALVIGEQLKKFRETTRNTFKSNTPDAIPGVTLQDLPDNNPLWNELFQKFQAIKNSNPLSASYSESQFLREAANKIRQIQNTPAPQRINITLQDLITNAPTGIQSTPTPQPGTTTKPTGGTPERTSTTPS